jgi:peptidyl-prolyl cis-trans isomerase C
MLTDFLPNSSQGKPMRIVSRLLLIGLVVAGIVACGKHSDTTVGGSTILATVNGTAITSEMVQVFVRANSGGREIQLNDEQRRQVLNNLVDFELLAEEARKAGVADQPDFKAELAVYENNQLARRFMKQYLDTHQVTDAQLQAAYATRLKAGNASVYKVRHILVADEALAEKLIAQLGKGADFGKLARQYSVDKNSAVNGGELGDGISPDGLVPEFSKAMVALKKGEYTKQPVHTQYGWHVIQLEDVQQPSFEQMRPQLTDELQNKTVEDYMNKLRGNAQVKIEDTTPAPAKTRAAASAKP